MRCEEPTLVSHAVGLGGIREGLLGHGWNSDAGGKGQAMQSICCADAGRGQLLGEIRCCCSSGSGASLSDCERVNFL